MEANYKRWIPTSNRCTQIGEQPYFVGESAICETVSWESVSKLDMIGTTYTFLAAVFMGAWCMTQAPRTPDIDAQRAAMRKLDFLVGEWAGEATILRAPGQVVQLAQSESAQFKLDGLVLVIEGVGRAKADGTVVLQALGLISFDDETGTYRMRAFNDGRWLETDVKLLDTEGAIAWGFALGDIKTSTVLRINEKGEWTEQGELTVGNRPPQKMMDLTVRPKTR